MVEGEWLVGGEWGAGYVSGVHGCKGMREVLTESGNIVPLTKLERDCVEDGRGISVMGRGPKKRYSVDAVIVRLCFWTYEFPV